MANIMIPTFDPLNFINQVIVIAVLIFLLFALYTYRERVLLALTGDTHVHADCLDCLWFVLRCGGYNEGEWTRCFTKFTCCPSYVRGQNCVKALGKLLGLYSQDVELRNLTVGDLPFQGRGDFFVTVTCSTNPTQVTSVAEDKDPKVVHFPEILTLRIRNNPFEQRVKLEVKELNFLGFQTLCSCYINAQTLLDWSRDPDNATKRIEMKPVEVEFEPESPPWVLLNLGEPLEPRGIRDMGANPNMVRTTVSAGHNQDYSFKEFKTAHRLVGASGDFVQEPSEDDLGKIRCLRNCLITFMILFNLVIFGIICLYATLRTYLYSCYHQFSELTMAKLNNKSFPISRYDLRKLMEYCDEEVEGTGLATGIPCRPSKAEIEVTCENLPPGQPAPGAGKVLAKDMLDLDVDGIHCFRRADSYANGESLFGRIFDELPGDNVCETRNFIQPYDSQIFVVLVLMMMSTCCVKMVGNASIRYKKHELQRKRADELGQALQSQENQTLLPKK
eukprot:TRINITY_DN11326_c0_g1_i1.p1 TRINITY_DN11326_c0_g1~~TRINITY_DN11326_c0_g1_i1.p1  ORF type:complete len:503 (+),score=96.01 TRINITY_DN11326_c0_g1_i1:109-1617(+)